MQTELIRTTILLQPSLFRRLKLFAQEQGKPVTEVVERAIRKVIETEEQPRLQRMYEGLFKLAEPAKRAFTTLPATLTRTYTGWTALGKENVTDFDVLVDSDAFVGLFLPDDAHNETCNRVFTQLAQDKVKLVATNYTVAETATVLSRQSGQPIARAFLDYIETGALPIIHIDVALQSLAISIFKEQANKKTSLFDCANVAVMRNLNIPSILSFDHVYAKTFALRTAV